MTSGQPTFGHCANAKFDEEAACPIPMRESQGPILSGTGYARSVFRPSALDDVAEAVSVATEKFHDIYVERRGDQYRWSFATKGGPYPLLRITARFLEMDPCSLVGVGSRVVEDAGPVGVVPSHEVEFIHALKVAVNCVVVWHNESASFAIES